MEEGQDWIRSDSTTKGYFNLALRALGIRVRRKYDARHTYATLCLMVGMNPCSLRTCWTLCTNAALDLCQVAQLHLGLERVAEAGKPENWYEIGTGKIAIPL